MGSKTDPVGVTLFPLGERTLRASALDHVSTDKSFCAPFGLTRAMPPRTHALNLSGVSYDRERQITVLADGTPFVAAPSMKSTLYCTSQTTEDMQSWPDSVPDGTD